jgi:predicted nuclease with TOPRIM domain
MCSQTSQLKVLQLKAAEVDDLRDQVSGLRDSNAYLQESITQARFRGDDPLREVELSDLRELVEDLKAELEDSQAEVDSLSGVSDVMHPRLTTDYHDAYHADYDAYHADY